MVPCRNCGGIGPRLERMDMGMGRMCSPSPGRYLTDWSVPSILQVRQVQQLSFKKCLLVRRHHLFPPLSVALIAKSVQLLPYLRIRTGVHRQAVVVWP